jgi:hypothetical protein
LPPALSHWAPREGFDDACGSGLSERSGDWLSELRCEIAVLEALLAAGSRSHNYLWFDREAIEPVLHGAHYGATGRYADALEGRFHRRAWPRAVRPGLASA